MAGKYANSREAAIGGTSPVDDFPLGVSPYGVWDMSGNVREWTASKHEDGDYRVVRGGSYNSDECLLHSTNRYRRAPDYTDYYLGFRCARSA